MYDRMIFAALVAVALITASCETQTNEAASDGSPPAVDIPVGPIPGPSSAPAGPSNPFNGNSVALREGRDLFLNYNCYGCHGGRGGGGMGPSLRDAAWLYGSSDAHVFDSIAEGRAKGMPAWGTKIPQDQIWKLVAYIKSMNSDDEPDKPVEE